MVKIKPGDKVVVKQEKTTTQLPWDPRPYMVTKVKNTKIFLERDAKPKIRSIEKCKLVKLPQEGGSC